MCFGHYELKKDRMPEESRQAVKKIGRMIKSDLAEKLTLELKRLTNPEHIVKDFIDFCKVNIYSATW
jgi:DNA-dependent protein kinase catalytic subunit